MYQAIGLDKLKALRVIIFIPVIFSIVCFAWIFFRANNLSDALILIDNLWTNNLINLIDGEIYQLGLTKPEFILAIIFIFILTIFEWTHGKINFSNYLRKQRVPIRWSTYIIICLIIIVFGVYGEDTISEFIYFQF